MTPARQALVLTLALTALAWAEKALAPWAPYYVVYAGLTTALPFVFGGLKFAPISRVGWRGWLLVLGTAIGLQALGAVWAGVLYPALLSAGGVPAAAQTGPMFEFGAAFQRMFEIVGARWHTAPAPLLGLYLGFIFLWAGLGEEVFYRGYLHERLARSRGFAFGAVVSSALFAVRHATQFALLGPEYPWPVVGMWLVLGFALGVWMCFLYARTGSLTVPVLAHYAFNAIPTLLYFLGPGAAAARNG
ncbi:MAG: lysostaphin resistance A-like protein [Candidatus Eiseniibacteriota bacterium]